MKKALSALAAVLLLVTAACGSDGSQLSDKERKVAGNIARELSGSDAGKLDKKAATCFADEFVDRAGVPALRKAGLIDKDGAVQQQGTTFDKGLAGKYADAYLACVDFGEQVAQAYAAQDPSLDEKAFAACLDDKLPKDTVRQVIVDNQTGKSGTSKEVTDAQEQVTGCQQKTSKQSGKQDSGKGKGTKKQ
jgi:hypothetical protein